MKRLLFCLWQWIWGFPQTLIGLFVFLFYFLKMRLSRGA